jgi:hypothetical protein
VNEEKGNCEMIKEECKELWEEMKKEIKTGDVSFQSVNFNVFYVVTAYCELMFTLGNIGFSEMMKDFLILEYCYYLIIARIVLLFEMHYILKNQDKLKRRTAVKLSFILGQFFMGILPTEMLTRTLQGSDPLRSEYKMQLWWFSMVRKMIILLRISMTLAFYIYYYKHVPEPTSM